MSDPPALHASRTSHHSPRSSFRLTLSPRLQDSSITIIPSSQSQSQPQLQPLNQSTTPRDLHSHRKLEKIQSIKNFQMSSKLLLLDDHHHLRIPHSSPRTLEFLTLTHPGTNAPCQFALARGGSTAPMLMEVTRACDPHGTRSWFVGNAVQSDGCIFLVTRVDPLFVVLPLLDASRAKFRVVDQLLRDEGGGAEWLRLVRCEGMTFRSICDVDDVDPDMVLVRLNESLVAQWLRGKVERLAKHLYAATAGVDFGGKAEGFTVVERAVVRVGEEKETGPREREARRRAVQLICDYLPERWREMLVRSEGMSLKGVLASTPGIGVLPSNDVSSTRREGEEELASATKKRTWEEENGYTNMSAQSEHLKYTRPSAVPPAETNGKKLKSGNTPPPSQPSLAVKQLAKVNTTGIPSITSFFKKV